MIRFHWGPSTVSTVQHPHGVQGFSFGKSCFKAKHGIVAILHSCASPDNDEHVVGIIALSGDPISRLRAGFGVSAMDMVKKCQKRQKTAIPCDAWPWRALHTFWDLKSWWELWSVHDWPSSTAVPSDVASYSQAAHQLHEVWIRCSE